MSYKQILWLATGFFIFYFGFIFTRTVNGVISRGLPFVYWQQFHGQFNPNLSFQWALFVIDIFISILAILIISTIISEFFKEN